MQKKSNSRSGFFSRRAITALLVCVAACSVLTGSLPAGLRSGAPATLSVRTITFAERVAYQRAIEEVYWRHRIWPEERPDPKPSLDAVMSQAQLEKKVTDYLRKSQALEDYWQRPITAGELQAEMDRMAKRTRQPDALHELFEALGNDPFVIAECLARPILSESFVTHFHANDQRAHRQLKPRVRPWRAGAGKQMPRVMAAAGVNYTLPEISDGPNGCSENSWTATSTTNAPTARFFHAAVWTGNEMIIWGGTDDIFTGLNTGARYNPTTDSWASTSMNNAPAGRYSHSAVWTGNEMIVWGGADMFNYLKSGARYNPGTDTWVATSTTNAPDPRAAHSAVWTGSEMIVWGGATNGVYFNSGGRYDPGTNSWTATSTTNAPSGRGTHTAVWTGNEMIVWGGTDGGHTYFDTGGMYNPSTDSWTATSIANAPTGRTNHTAVWTGCEMVVWGGVNWNNPVTYFDTGAKYHPDTERWTATSTDNAPDGRFSHTAVWTGTEMIIWGGAANSPNNVYFDTGGWYDPLTNSWTPTNTTNAPAARYYHTSVWSGTGMIVWGGLNGSPLNSGGRYCTQFASTVPSPVLTGRLTPTPRPRPTPAPRPCP